MARKFELNVVTICGSLRKGSYAAAVLRALPALSPGGMGFTPFPSIGDVPHYDGDLETSSGVPHSIALLANAMRETDGVIIVSPEYNYSVPGVLKNTIDWVSRPYGDSAWKGKPVAIMGASAGVLGTARAQYHLRQTFVFLDMPVVNQPEVMIGSAAAKFDANGNLADDMAKKLIGQLLTNLCDLAKRYGAGS